MGSVQRGMWSLPMTINGDSNLSDIGHSVLVYVNAVLEMSKQLNYTCTLLSDSLQFWGCHS